MKAKILLGIAIAGFAINLCLPPVEAASPNYSRWPRWYYYDVMGLREWNKGEKKRAMAYFDESFRGCENDTLRRTRGGALDPQTKKMVKEVINHQLFHMSLWESAPNPNVQQKMGGAEQAAVTAQAMANDVDRNLKWLDRLESFAIKVLGKKTVEVQNIQLYRTKYFNFKDENMRITRALRNPSDPRHKTGPATPDDWRVYDQVNVPRPDWWRKNERDYTPETFTRDPRAIKEKKAAEPYESRKSVLDASNPHGNPDAKFTPGTSYSAGQKYEPYKKSPNDTGPGWGSGSSVGSIDGNIEKNPGWGTANQGQRKPKSSTEWGVERDIMDVNRPKKQPDWSSPDDSKERDTQQQWGGGGGGNPDDKKTQW